MEVRGAGEQPQRGRGLAKHGRSSLDRWNRLAGGIASSPCHHPARGVEGLRIAMHDPMQRQGQDHLIVVNPLGLPIVAGFLAHARAGVAPGVHLAGVENARNLPASGLLQGLVELGHRDMQGEHLREQQRHRVVARVAPSMLQKDPLVVALAERLGHQTPRGRHQRLVVQDLPAGPKGLGRDEHPVHRFPALGQDRRLARRQKIAGASELRFDGTDAVVEVGLMRRLADHQNRPPQFLQEKIRRLDGSAAGGRTPPAGPLGRCESTVVALMLEGHLDALPSPVSACEVAGHHRRDHGPATAPLRASLDPASLTSVPAGQPLIVGQVILAEPLQPSRRQRLEHIILAKGWCGIRDGATERQHQHNHQCNPATPETPPWMNSEGTASGAKSRDELGKGHATRY